MLHIFFTYTEDQNRMQIGPWRWQSQWLEIFVVHENLVQQRSIMECDNGSQSILKLSV